MHLPKASSSGSLGRISLNAASVLLEGLAVLLEAAVKEDPEKNSRYDTY
jgi:hypothetical protein